MSVLLKALLLRPRELPMPLDATDALTDPEPEVTGALRLTLRVQLPAAAIVPPVSVKLVSPATTDVPPPEGELSVAPEQVVWALGVGAMTSPLGKVGVTAVNGRLTLALGLVSVMVSVVVSPTCTDDGEKASMPVGLLKGPTASVALAAVAFVTVLPLSEAENPGVLPPAVKPLAGPLAGIVVV